jgi:hypothetical protein
MTPVDSHRPSAPSIRPHEPHDSRLPLVHILLIATTAPQATLAAIADGIGRTSGQLRSLSLKPVGDGFEAMLRLTGGGEHGAERLAASIARWPRAGSVRVEHQALLP